MIVVLAAVSDRLLSVPTWALVWAVVSGIFAFVLLVILLMFCLPLIIGMLAALGKVVPRL